MRRAFVVLMSVAACNQVFGIEEAHVDPSIRSSLGGGGQGGVTASQGGVSVSSGGATIGTGGGAHGGSSAGGAAPGSGGALVAQGGELSTGGATAMGGSGSSEGGAGGAGGVPGGSVSLCNDYCETITQYCTGDTLQYKDLEQCLKVCQSFPQGMVGEPDGDTVACRLKYAGKARYAGGIELAAYCRQGGPGGDGRCGDNCEGFCDITQTTCNAAETAPYFFPSRAACLNTCNGLPDVPFVYGSKTSADGNSVQCRLFHVISAAMSDADEHCAHVMGITLCEESPTN